MSTLSRVSIELLACPTCGAVLLEGGAALRCAQGHGFDIARQGYVSLLGGGRRATSADTPEMVAARDEFLNAGHYDPIATAVTAAVTAAVSDSARTVVDVAGGTGHYLAAVLDAQPSAVGLAIDLSVPAVKRAARRHDRMAAVVADAWQPLPVRTGSVDAVLSVFGPRNPSEFARVLAPTGALVVVTPTPRHLAEIRGALGMLDIDDDKSARLDAKLAGFARTETSGLEYPISLDQDDLRREVMMGPSAHHVTSADLDARMPALDLPVTTTVSVEISTWRVR